MCQDRDGYLEDMVADLVDLLNEIDKFTIAKGQDSRVCKKIRVSSLLVTTKYFVDIKRFILNEMVEAAKHNPARFLPILNERAKVEDELLALLLELKPDGEPPMGFSSDLPESDGPDWDGVFGGSV